MLFARLRWKALFGSQSVSCLYKFVVSQLELLARVIRDSSEFELKSLKCKQHRFPMIIFSVFSDLSSRFVSVGQRPFEGEPHASWSTWWTCLDHNAFRFTKPSNFVSLFNDDSQVKPKVTETCKLAVRKLVVETFQVESDCGFWQANVVVWFIIRPDSLLATQNVARNRK